MLLMVLLTWARADLTVYHGQQDLAAELGYHPSYVRIILAELCEEKILEVNEKPRRGYVTGYTIHLDRLPEATTTPTPAGRNGRSLQPQAESNGTGTVHQSMAPATPTKGDRVAPIKDAEEATPLLNEYDYLTPIENNGCDSVARQGRNSRTHVAP